MIWKRQKDFFFDALLLEAIEIGFTAKKFTYIMSIMYLFVSGNGEKWNKIEFPSGEKYNFLKTCEMQTDDFGAMEKKRRFCRLILS